MSWNLASDAPESMQRELLASGPTQVFRAIPIIVHPVHAAAEMGPAASAEKGKTASARRRARRRVTVVARVRARRSGAFPVRGGLKARERVRRGGMLPVCWLLG